MEFFLQVSASGLAAGALYSIIAVGYSITYTATRTFNFALGMWAMLGGMLTYSLFSEVGLNPLLTLATVMATLLALGIVAERYTVRPFLDARSELWIMSTLAVGFLLIDFSEILWGRDPLPVSHYLGSKPIVIGTVLVLPQNLLILGSCGVLFLSLEFFYQRTLSGKALRAVAYSRETAALMGISIRKTESLSYAVACMFAGVAGFLVVPLTLAEPQLGTVLGFKAFAVAIMGGLTSPIGILLFGLGYGILEALISGYFYTGIRDIAGFSFMISVLYFFPQGLFGGVEVQKV